MARSRAGSPPPVPVPFLLSVLFLLLGRRDAAGGGGGVRGSSVYPASVVYPHHSRQISWHPRVFLYPHFLSDDEANHLVSLASGELKKSSVADIKSGKSTLSEVRTSSGYFISKGKDPIVAGIEDKIAAWTFLPKENGEDMQVLRYKRGEKYEPKYDYFTDSVNTMRGGHRVATVLLYLTDVAEGGETVFPLAKERTKKGSHGKDAILSECAKNGIAVKPRKGDALLFFNLLPNAATDPSSLHGGCEVIKGEKWSATKWIRVASFNKVYHTPGGNCTDSTAGQGEEGDKPVVEGEEADGEEKKEQEPFAVPTSGAFYMHDDRFAENGRGGGGRRRMLGGRKLWDAKDDQAWVHDRFEEMNVHDRFDERYEDKRGSRGRFRGRGGGGRTRGTARGSSRGGRYRSYHEDSENQNLGDSQNRPQKVVRGRGPRRYDAIAKNTREVVGYQRKQPARSREPAAHSALDREAGQISNAHSDAVPAKKNVVNSSLNSASPPFYPSGASNHAGAQRRDMQAGGSNNMKLQSGPIVRGRGTTDYGGRDRFHAEGHVRPSPTRTAGASSNSSGFAASSVNAGQSPTVRAQGGNSSIGVPSHNQPTSSFHQTSRTSAQQQNHTSVMHQKSGQVPTQPGTRIPTQQLSHRSNPSPTAQHLPARSTESGENGSYPSSNQSKTVSSEVEKTNKEIGRGSFTYGGAQIIGSAGAAGLAQGEQNNFPGTPALLPVMQFAGQHPGGLGVGMALPGYVAQQQLGMGNNEMAWLPLLAGAAGAFGGSYPPYITLDPSFYSRSSGQTSSSVPSREANVNKGAKSPPENDIVTEELDQRQNKPRRYSEMNFSQ